MHIIRSFIPILLQKSSPTERLPNVGHAGDGFQRPLVPRSRFQPRLHAQRSAKGLLRNAALHLHGLGHMLCHKLKNWSLNYAGWLSLLPDNVLQAFNSFWAKQTFVCFSAHSRRDILNDENFPLLLKYIGDFLFLKSFFPHFMAHRSFSSP